LVDLKHCCPEATRLTLGDLLALVDLCDFLVEELVALLADLDNLLALEAQSYISSVRSDRTNWDEWGRKDAPVTASSTLCEI
jgi:hypothetical protein